MRGLELVNVIFGTQPGNFADPLTEVLRKGARALLAQAVEAEVATLLSRYADETTENGHHRLVRHGHLPEREIMTGIGPVAVRCPRVRDRVGEGSERIRFSSAILPPYARRSKSLEVLIPILYLKGISTGDFEEALTALLGKDAGGLSASTIGRLKEAWSEEHARWSKRDLSAKRYVYFWVDGIHVQARLEDAAQAVPGPLFTFSAYLGAVMKSPPNGIAGAVISLIAIFLPGNLVLIGALPFWETFRRRSDAQAIMRGVNAAVVGLLGAALYNPVWTSAVKTPGDFALALVGFVLLTVWQAPPLVVVAISALGGIGLALA